MSALLPTYARSNLTFERGEGAYLFTESGERYLDFAGGIAVNSLGHAHPHLVDALAGQAAKLWHTSNLYRIPGQDRLAERLAAQTFADLVFFTNSGAEALECAIKVARRYHWSRGDEGRYRVITFEGAFHGRTLSTIAAGGQDKHLEGFGPPVDGFDSVPLGDIDSVRAAIVSETAAILVEPVQGESGIKGAGWPFLNELRALADEAGLALIFDEVQTGIGRTGELFAHEWSQATPDIMAIAKGIGGGFPVGACLTTREAGAAMTAGSHGSTFGGNPLAMAVGNAVLDVVLEPGFLEQVRLKGLRLKQRLAALRDEFPDLIAEIRGEGLMLGIKCTDDAGALLAALREEGVLSAPAGDNVVRWLPPLIIGDREIEEACDGLARACRRLKASQPIAG